LLRTSITISDQLIPLQALVRFERKQEEDYLVGVEFVQLNNLHRGLINKMVLRIEREQQKKEFEKKQDQF